MEYIKHITTEGERWDLIAKKYYKDPTQYEIIINANPDVDTIPILPSGIKLQIPVVEIEKSIPNEDLPPWGRV